MNSGNGFIGMAASEISRIALDTSRRTTLEEVRQELVRADAWPGFNSAHEGYSILMEEVDELWTHVKVNQKRRDLAEMRAEAIQVAAMAVKFVEMIDSGRGRV
jgi:NTP pyrophosphatase (non-canonical NTP hydrolase)